MIPDFSHTDEALLKQMAEDDREAFTLLYRRYWEGLFITAAKALRDKEEAGDVVQDVFLSLWNRRHELRIEGSLAAYLHTSVRYKAIQYIEKNITRRDYLAMFADVAIQYPPPNAEISLQLKEMEQAIGKSVARMPPKMQEVYLLSRQKHLSHKQIAEQLDISAETVKKHIHNALQLIKVNLPHCDIIILIFLSFQYC